MFGTSGEARMTPVERGSNPKIIGRSAAMYDAV
jgi:hypothetical protein